MRNKNKLIVLLIFFSLLPNHWLLADWVKMSNGINGGHVYSFALVGSAVFAGTENHGLYLSTNQGMSWKETDLGSITVFSLTVNGSSIFAGTNHGVYSSSNNGLIGDKPH